MEKEIFANIEFGFNETKEFLEPESNEFSSRQGKYEVEFMFMEIKSVKPPTDVIIKIRCTKPDNNQVKNITVQFIKYRSLFKFENGYYIISLNEIEELKERVVPHKITYSNKRDTESTANLIYRILFQV